MWGETDHTGVMARECGVPHVYGAVWALHKEEGLNVGDAQREFHARARSMHGRRVRLYRVGSKAWVEVVE